MAIQSTVYTPTPIVTTTTAPSTYKLTRPIASSSSPSSPRPWRRCAMWLADGGRWAFRRRYELAPVTITTGLTGIGLAQGGGPGTAFVYGLLAAGSAAGAVGGLKHKMSPVAYTGAAGVVAFGDIAAAVGFGFSWPTITAWVLSTGAAYGAYVPWLTAQRNQRMKLHVDTIKARAAVPGALGMDAADPGLTGGSPEETALRRGLHALTGHTPLDVLAMNRQPDGSWSCLVKLPPGRSTAPGAIIRKLRQLESNIGLPGRLVLAHGPESNDLVVKMKTQDALADTIPFEQTKVTTCKAPVLIGQDDEGNEFHLQLLYRHTLVAGATDWGKSGITNLVIMRLAQCHDAELFGIDMKPGAPELGPWRSVMNVARTKEEARALLEGVFAECQRRGAVLRSLSDKQLAEGRGPVRKWIPGLHGKAWFVFTDELAELVRQDPKLAELYESCLAVTRFTGIQFVSATQQPSRKVFGGSTDARGNYANRLSTRMGESGHGPLIFGAGSVSRGYRPERLDLPGKFLALTPEHDAPRIYRAQFVSDEDIAAAVSFHHSDVQDTDEQPAITDEPWVEQFAPLRFPDGTPVGDAWPDLWRIFQEMGSATKAELTEAGPYDSRDTARRAFEEWTKHGVLERRDGISTRYYLPTVDLTKDD